MPALSYWFTGSALAAFIALLAAAGTLGYGWYRAAITEMNAAINEATSTAQKAQTARVKDLLGKQMELANALLRELPAVDESKAEHDAEVWGEKTRDLINAAYGSGEAALFLDSSGYVFYADQSKNVKIRNWIDGRMRRITELLQRADRLTVRDGFDASKFE